MAKPEEKKEDGPPKKDNKEGLPEVRGAAIACDRCPAAPGPQCARLPRPPGD
jgi:hypothetical protein